MVAGPSALVAAVAAAQSLALVSLGYLLRDQTVGGGPTSTTTTSTPAASEPPLCLAAAGEEPAVTGEARLWLAVGICAGFGFAVLLATLAGGVRNLAAWLAGTGQTERVGLQRLTHQDEKKPGVEFGEGTPSPLPLRWD